RVDIIYGSRSARTKLWIDVFGILFFLTPACIMMTEMAWGFFMDSFERLERSSNAGGLPVWPVKVLLPLGFTLLLFQGVSELIKRIAGLQGHPEYVPAYEKPLQ
ncbi:MAG: TRAP transporter small permease subunit, partial [Paracoccaceae bacterium]